MLTLDPGLAVRTAEAAAGRGRLATVFAEAQHLYRAVADGPDVQLSVHSRGGTGLSCVSSDGVRHRHLPSVDDETLPLLVAALRDPGPPAPPGHGRPWRYEHDLDAAERLAELVALASETVSLAEPGVTVGRVSGEALVSTVFVAREDGLVREDHRTSLELRISALARRGDATARALRVVSAERYGTVDRGTVRAAARSAAAAAARNLDAVDVPVGELPVVLAAGGPAALLHEVCGHGLEADVARHPGSAYHGLIDRKLTTVPLTLIDSPTAPHGAGLYRVDDEGEPAQEVTLIADGVLRSYLHDRRTALSGGGRAHGHGRRLSYAHPALPRMSSTYVAPGACPAEEVIASTARGLYVESILSGETDMSSGRFSVRVTSGRLIEHGRLTAPVRETTLAGTGSEVLAGIDLIGDDLRFLPYGYQCNKLGQFPLTVSVGQPTLRVARLAVTGP
ncbi:TldD/PmbA family protein [Streptomyces huiliensis]|uniref:TldD/PmbA family protein n=1 Tax=Streptomyces huiliensis TaxID=2876027 RepID=UPI001CBCDB19|nr:TldD/PmbA family protein [Streptomyces huiliensis]MBZ4319936.1 TldD/PmbA family protein [Streptomyces huiliensis]